MSNLKIEYLNRKLKEWSLQLDSKKEQQFLSYFEILVQWNSVMNLTSIINFEEVMDKHFLDSISMCNIIDFKKNAEYKLIDVGTGAGFPGIPLKIMFPELKITLLDSLLKRVNFLDEVVNNLNLDHVELIHGRAEDFGRKEVYREKYDIATSRAVANLASLSEICLPFVKKDGLFISYKAEKASEELSLAMHAIALLNGKVKEEKSFCLPKTNFSRTLIVIEKMETISDKYPRKAGIPFKRPLS